LKGDPGAIAAFPGVLSALPVGLPQVVPGAPGWPGPLGLGVANTALVKLTAAVTPTTTLVRMLRRMIPSRGAAAHNTQGYRQYVPADHNTSPLAAVDFNPERISYLARLAPQQLPKLMHWRPGPGCRSV
jgi:hypothetical protein